MIKVIVAAALLTASTSASAVVNLLSNAGFENGTKTPGVTPLVPGLTALTGWNILGAGVGYADNAAWNANAGRRSIELNNNGERGGVGQRAFGFTVGQRYVLKFALSADPYNITNLPPVRVVASITGGIAQLFSYSNNNINTPTNMLYSTQTYVFRATRTFQDIQFRSLTRGSFGPVIDAVSISVIPEPSTWAMLLAGFGLVGYSARRRNRAAVVA